MDIAAGGVSDLELVVLCVFLHLDVVVHPFGLEQLAIPWFPLRLPPTFVGVANVFEKSIEFIFPQEDHCVVGSIPIFSHFDRLGAVG